jgi:hypothetical protein
VTSLIDIAFPYRRRQTFGAASFAFTFLVLLFEVELLAFVGVALVARQPQLWWDLQAIVFPTACLVSLAAATVFWWRARSWSKHRVQTLEAWARGGTTFGQQLAQRTNRDLD